LKSGINRLDLTGEQARMVHEGDVFEEMATEATLLVELAA
jgi:hypothetical protein